MSSNLFGSEYRAVMEFAAELHDHCAGDTHDLDFIGHLMDEAVAAAEHASDARDVVNAVLVAVLRHYPECARAAISKAYGARTLGIIEARAKIAGR